MTEPLIYSILVGAVVGFSAGYLGSIMVLEKMALVGVAGLVVGIVTGTLLLKRGVVR